MSKKEEGEPPSQGLMLFHNVLSRKGFNIAGKVKVTKRGVFSAPGLRQNLSNFMKTNQGGKLQE